MLNLIYLKLNVTANEILPACSGQVVWPLSPDVTSHCHQLLHCLATSMFSDLDKQSHINVNSMFSIRLNVQQHSIKLTAMKAYFHHSKGQTSPCVFDTVRHVHSNPSFSWKNTEDMDYLPHSH